MADLEEELDGQEADDGEGHGAGAEQNADEVEDAGEDDGDVGVERVGVPVKLNMVVQRGVNDGEIDGEPVADEENSTYQQDDEEDGAPFARGGFCKLGVEDGSRTCDLRGDYGRGHRSLS